MTHLPGQLKVFNKASPRLNVEVATLASLGSRSEDPFFGTSLGRNKSLAHQLPAPRPGSRAARQQEARDSYLEL